MTPFQRAVRTAMVHALLTGLVVTVINVALYSLIAWTPVIFFRVLARSVLLSTGVDDVWWVSYTALSLAELMPQLVCATVVGVWSLSAHIKRMGDKRLT
jgi:hypothetical protein